MIVVTIDINLELENTNNVIFDIQKDNETYDPIVYRSIEWKSKYFGSCSLEKCFLQRKSLYFPFIVRLDRSK